MFYSDMMAKNANFKICYAYVSGLSSLRYKRECVYYIPWYAYTDIIILMFLYVLSCIVLFFFIIIFI